MTFALGSHCLSFVCWSGRLPLLWNKGSCNLGCVHHIRMTCGPQIRIHQRVDPKQQISMTVLVLFSVPKCWCIRVSLHMCRAIWPVAIWLHTQRSKHAVVLWKFHTTHTDVLESMSLGHYKYSGLRATCHLPLQIQWSESNMIRNIGICSSIVLVYTQNVVFVLETSVYTRPL